MTLYSSGDWWDDDGFWLGLRTLLDPLRVPYLSEKLAPLRPASILDVGAGGGFVSDALSARGHLVIGVDISQVAIESARLNASGYFTVGDAHSLPFPDESFDAVICSEVLEHVDRPGDVLAESARALRRGGLLLFSTPNRTLMSRLVLIELAQRWSLTSVLPADLHAWHRFVKPTELQAMLSHNDLEIQDIVGTTIAPSDLPGALHAYVQLKRRRISYGEAGRRIRIRAGSSTSVSYMGYAIKGSPDDPLRS